LALLVAGVVVILLDFILAATFTLSQALLEGTHTQRPPARLYIPKTFVQITSIITITTEATKHQQRQQHKICIHFYGVLICFVAENTSAGGVHRSW